MKNYSIVCWDENILNRVVDMLTGAKLVYRYHPVFKFDLRVCPAERIVFFSTNDTLFVQNLSAELDNYLINVNMVANIH